MPSSTSSSESGSANRFIAILLAGLVLFLAGVEIFTRRVAMRASRIQRLTEEEWRGGVALRPGGAAGPRTVLLAGNSLLEAAVDMDELRRQLGPKYTVQRLVVHQTSYLDWYFGLRHLHTEGSRPDVVIVMLSPLQFANMETRGDYFAHHMLDTTDVPAAIGQAKIHPTAGSGFLLARFSAFYGFRTEFRKVAAIRLIPGLQSLLSVFARRDNKPQTSFVTDHAARLRERAAQLAQLRRELAIPLVLAISPSGAGAPVAAGEQAVRAALADSGVPVIQPLAAGQTDPSFYSDGFHLNAAGEKLFTARMAEAIRSLP